MSRVVPIRPASTRQLEEMERAAVALTILQGREHELPAEVLERTGVTPPGAEVIELRPRRPR